MSAISKEMGLSTSFKPARLPDIEKELLRIDEVKTFHLHTCIHVCACIVILQNGAILML